MKSIGLLRQAPTLLKQSFSCYNIRWFIIIFKRRKECGQGRPHTSQNTFAIYGELSKDMSYKVRLKAFEGPFDLLVFLIENAQMSIYDINVSEIVEQYLEYVEQMKQMEVSVATEFMVLAASLIEIKSKMLLPRMNQDGDVVLDEDPRTELVEKILEYKKFKAAAAMLQESEEYMLNVYEKPQDDLTEYTDSPDEYLKMGIDQFVSAFNAFLYRKKKVEEVQKHYTRLERQRVSIEQRIAHIKSFFLGESPKKSVTFTELIEDKKQDRYSIVVTFTSILEMAKSRAIGVRQKSNFDEIVVTRGENLESFDAGAAAEQELAEAGGAAAQAIPVQGTVKN